MADDKTGWRDYLTTRSTASTANATDQLAILQGGVVKKIALLNLDLNSRDNIKKYGTNAVPGTTNMTAAFQAAIDAGSKVSFDAATYLVDVVNLKGSLEIAGAGIDKTIIKQGTVPANGSGTFVATSSGVNAYLDNIYIHDLTIDGQAAIKGFNQQIHLITLAGTSNVLIERVKFVGMRGDGLAISEFNSAGTYPGQNRHNKHIIVRDCIFDGVANLNRNGISVMSGEDILIQRCKFFNVARADMPGAIDIEPDFSNNIVRNITVADCYFYNTKGSAGSIGLYLQDLAYDVPPSGFKFLNNTIFDDANGDQGITLHHVGNAVAARKHDILVSGNTVNGALRGFLLYGLNGALLVDNFFGGLTQEPLIGLNASGFKNMNVTLDKNTFSKNTAFGGLTVFSVDYLTLSRNTFIDSGPANQSGGYAIDFGEGVSSYVSLLDNMIQNPGGVTLVAINKESGHVFNRTTNQKRGNQLIGCTGDAFDAVSGAVYWFDSTVLPDSFPVGVTSSLVNGDTNLPDATFKQGILQTSRLTDLSGYRKFTVQHYYPANNDATTLAIVYSRKGLDGSNAWSAWHTLTGQ